MWCLRRVIETFTVGGGGTERVPVATETVVAEVVQVIDVASSADEAARLEKLSLVVHRQPRLPVWRRHRMTPYMRGPALTCDAGGPVMVVSVYRIRAGRRPRKCRDIRAAA